MYHLVYKIVLVTFFLTNVSAEITQAQLDKYMEVSRSGAFLKYLENKMFYIALNIYDVNESKTQIKLIKNNINNVYYRSLYTEQLKENLNNNEYIEIMKFYNTDVGKKYAHSTEKNFIFKKKKMDVEIHQDFKSFLEKFPFSENKKILINQIRNALHTLDISIRSSEKQEIYRKHTFPLKNNQSNDAVESIASIKARTVKSYQKMKQWDEEVSMIFFKDFTENELEEVLDYTSTEVAQKEYKLMVEGSNVYKIKILEDMLLSIQPKAQTHQNNPCP